MTIYHYLELSTAHLPKAIFDQLSSTEGVIVRPFEYGAFLWVPGGGTDVGTVDEHNDDYDIPEEVTALQEYARSRGCHWILLDADADKDPALDSWDWDTGTRTEGHRPLPQPTVWVLIITHKHGEEVQALTNEVAARRRLYEWVVENWDQEMPSGMAQPADPDKAISAYFSQVDEEGYTLTETTIEDH